MEEKNVNLLSLYKIISDLDSSLNYDIKIEYNKIEIKEHFVKRSLDANGYYWHLINQLANVLRKDKDKVHLDMLKAYSQVEIITALEKVPIDKYFKYYEKYKETEKNGNKFIVYKIYQPSSTMNKKQFSILLDGLIQECEQQGITTGTREQINALLESMS